VASAAPGLPGYANVVAMGAAQWTWNYGVTDPAATLLPGGGGVRVAACWYGAQPYGFDVVVNDGKAHRFSAYFLDWDSAGRRQRIDIIDSATGAILNSQTISNFDNGVYLTWDVAGSVKMRLTTLAGGNAVASALFFDSIPNSIPTAPNPPNSPTTLAVAALNSSQIKVSWTDNSSNETGFRVFRRTETSSFIEVATLPAGSAGFTNTSLLSEAQYTYKVCAFNSAGNSVFTTEGFATTAPYAPRQLAAYALSPTQVQVSWSDNSSRETGFKIFRRISGGSYGQVGTALANSTNWVDATASPGVRYYYTVCASGPSIDSGFFAEASAVTPTTL
jgi:hypothetical protein